MYQTVHTSRSEFVPIRQLNYHVRLWGPETSSLPPLVLVHGWMDVAASYQFVVDAFGAAFMQDGASSPPTGGFWPHGAARAHRPLFFPDYLADLDQLLDHYAPNTPVDLVGHSMAATWPCSTPGAPGRIRRLVNLEGFGMPDNQPAKALARSAEWMDQLKALQRGEMALKTYDSVDGVARRLMKTNPASRRTRPTGWPRTGRSRCPGQWHILGDAAHKITNAQLFRLEEALAHYAAITAPTLAIEASDDSLGLWWKGRYTREQYHERLQSVPDCRTAQVADAGHMLHHDQPQAVAALIASFLD